MKALRNTKTHLAYWKNRKIDWQESYLKTWNHKHRSVISSALRLFPWISLFEIGVGGGANIVRLVKDFPGKQIGGIDINKEAIEFCSKTFKGGLFKVGDGKDIMMSDKSVDVVLTDMTLIYISPWEIKKYLKEIERITRSYVVFCEFHSDSLWNRIALKLNTGYYAHNYKKLLQNAGFCDILDYKLTPEDWPETDGTPGHEPQKTFAHIIIAKVPITKRINKNYVQ